MPNPGDRVGHFFLPTKKWRGKMKNLKCRACGRDYPLTASAVCEECFGPLEVTYNYDNIRTKLSRELIQHRGKNMWRYRELLPLSGAPACGKDVGDRKSVV